MLMSKLFFMKLIKYLPRRKFSNLHDVDWCQFFARGWYDLQVRSQEVALDAVAPSAGPIAPSGASLCTPQNLRYMTSPSFVFCLVDSIANGFAPSGILAWLQAW